jgi:hypothetical protein
VNKVDIFKYTDARAYLHRCRELQVPPWPLSYSVLSDRIGVNKGLIWAAFNGKKMFTRKMADRLPGILQLKKNEAVYLRIVLSLSNIDDKLRVLILNKFRPVKYRKT